MEGKLHRIESELKRRIEERSAALVKERNFISAILDTAGALILVLDREGRIIRFNRACEDSSGYAFEEVKNRRIWDLFMIPEEVMPIQATFKNIIDGNFPGKHESFWVTKEGDRRRIAWSTTALFDDEGKLEYGIWIGLDITERNRAEEDLRASEERYRALLENVKDGVALIRKRKIVYANDAFLSMFCHQTVETLEDTDIVQLVAPDFRSRFVELLDTALDQKSWGLTFRGRCLRKDLNDINDIKDGKDGKDAKTGKDGSDFWAEILTSAIRHEGAPAILATVRDITENMLWEQAIKDEAEYFRSENVRLKSSIGERYRLLEIIGKSPAMQKVYERILDAAATDAGVMVLGRSGTGKELVAKAIHELSGRAQKPFVPVNCSAIAETLIESEFFGHRRGAFTGAHANKEGYLEAAHTGTLFLDEVGDIGLNMQVKLLRALESGEYVPVGDHRVRMADIRIIAATNKEPMEMVRAGLMREDFFYRISVIPVTVPPLKDRKEDIPLLVENFLRKQGKNPKQKLIPAEVMDGLMRYDWPGNVRELQNVLQRYLTVKSLDFLEIPTGSATPQQLSRSNPLPAKGQNIDETLAGIEREMIIHALETCRWNRTQAAAALGISRRALFRKMKRLGA